MQDALDGLDFASGPADSDWGRVRASMGRSKPFPLKYITLGNENCNRPHYLDHYRQFSAVVLKRHPGVKLISNCDLGVAGVQAAMWEFHSYRDAIQTFKIRKALDDYKVTVTDICMYLHGKVGCV